MSDLKLFRIDSAGINEVKGSSVSLEKSLQNLIERYLDSFLGIRFLASEYSTGPAHGGRIDTLGIDENGCPVIIEYKRTLNQNVINQGLFYLDWLLDHKGDFKILVLERLGQAVADSIDWSAPRLLCIAGDFNKYDAHAIQQINRNIELIRYRQYGKDHILFELVNAVTAQALEETNGGVIGADKASKSQSPKTIDQQLASTKPHIADLFDSFKAFCLALGDDVQMKTLKRYYAFRRLKNFACAEIRQNNLIIYLHLDPDSIKPIEGITRDVHSIGHWGTGDLEVKIASPEDLEQAKPLVVASYENS